MYFVLFIHVFYFILFLHFILLLFFLRNASCVSILHREKKREKEIEGEGGENKSKHKQHISKQTDEKIRT